jgi:hypothetical protein
MNEPPITSDLSPKKVGRLLKIYIESEEKTDSTISDQQKILLLKSYLSDTLPLSSQILQSLPVLMQQIYSETSRLEGQSLYELLLDPNTELNHLKVTKALAKKKVNNAHTREEKEVAEILYYATIAAAVAHHNEIISKNSYRKLKKSFEYLLSKVWIFSELKDLFETARNKCTQLLSDK